MRWVSFTPSTLFHALIAPHLFLKMLSFKLVTRALVFVERYVSQNETFDLFGLYFKSALEQVYSLALYVPVYGISSIPYMPPK